MFEDIINIIEKPPKRWYISKTDDPDNPQCMISDDNELWIRPDIWKKFVSNAWVKDKANEKE